MKSYSINQLQEILEERPPRLLPTSPLHSEGPGEQYVYGSKNTAMYIGYESIIIDKEKINKIYKEYNKHLKTQTSDLEKLIPDVNQFMELMHSIKGNKDEEENENEEENEEEEDKNKDDLEIINAALIMMKYNIKLIDTEMGSHANEEVGAFFFNDVCDNWNECDENGEANHTKTLNGVIFGIRIFGSGSERDLLKFQKNIPILVEKMEFMKPLASTLGELKVFIRSDTFDCTFTPGDETY